MFNGNDPRTQALLAALARGGLQQPTARQRSPIVQQMMAQMLAHQNQPRRVSSYGQLAAELGTVFLQKQALKKAIEAESAEQQQSNQVQLEIARSLMGGGNPANAQATDPMMVQTTGQRLPDVQEALMRALSPEGGRAVQDNSMLQKMLAGELEGPKMMNVPAGGVIFDPRSRSTVYENPIRDRAQQDTTSIKDFEYAQGKGGFKGSFMDFLRSGRGSSNDEATRIEEYKFAKGEGFKGSFIDFIKSAKASGDFRFRAADANTFSRSAAEAYGGFVDPVTGKISGLNREKAAKAAELSSRAARIYMDSDGDLSHNEAFNDALTRQRRTQPGVVKAPATAIEHLKKNPHLKDAFKQKYGYLPEDL